MCLTFQSGHTVPLAVLIFKKGHNDHYNLAEGYNNDTSLVTKVPKVPGEAEKPGAKILATDIQIDCAPFVQFSAGIL